MEHCEICDRPVAYQLRSLAKGQTGIVCSGPCGGRTVHAKCAKLGGAVLDALTGGQLGLFWFCERCRRPERKALAERNHLQLTELSAIRMMTVKMLETVDEGLKGLGKGKEDKACQYEEVEEQLKVPLPAEIWLKIFGYLGEAQLLKARATCRRWRDLLEGCSALRGKFLPRFPKGVLIDRDYEPAFLFPAASSMFFGEARVFEVGSWWGRIGQGLTEIHFCDCKCVLLTLLTMLREAPNLKEMSWSDVMMDTVEGAGSEVDFRLDKMEKLNFKGEKDFKILTIFQKICPKLKILLIGSDELDDADLNHAVSFVEAVQDTLETLQITATDEAINKMLKFERLKLKQLVLDGTDISDKTIAVDLCRKNPTLTGLHLQQGFSLRGSDLKELGESLPNLEFFSTHFPRQMQILPDFLPYLSRNLRHLALVGDHRERHTINFTVAVDSTPALNLTHLTLHDLKLPNDSLRQLFAKTPRLSSLMLETVDFTCWPDLYAALAELTKLVRLQLVVVSTLETATCVCPATFNALPTLRELKINCCDFEKEELISLIRVFPNLARLKLYNMDDRFDDGVVRVICEKLNHLNELKIVGCALTPAQEREIHARFHTLGSLMVSEDCQNCD